MSSKYINLNGVYNELKGIYCDMEIIVSTVHEIVYDSLYNKPKDSYFERNKNERLAYIVEEVRVNKELKNLSVKFISLFTSLFDRIYSTLRNIFDGKGKFIQTSDTVDTIIEKCKIHLFPIYEDSVRKFLKDIKENKLLIEINSSAIRNSHSHSHSNFKLQVSLSDDYDRQNYIPDHEKEAIPECSIKIFNNENKKSCLVLDTRENKNDFREVVKFSKNSINNLKQLIDSFRLNYNNHAHLPRSLNMFFYDSVHGLCEENIDIVYTKTDDNYYIHHYDDRPLLLYNSKMDKEADNGWVNFTMKNIFSHSEMVFIFKHKIDSKTIIKKNKYTNRYFNVNDSVKHHNKNISNLFEFILKNYSEYKSMYHRGTITIKLLCKMVNDMIIQDKKYLIEFIYNHKFEPKFINLGDIDYIITTINTMDSILRNNFLNFLTRHGESNLNIIDKFTIPELNSLFVMTNCHNIRVYVEKLLLTIKDTWCLYI